MPHRSFRERVQAEPVVWAATTQRRLRLSDPFPHSPALEDLQGSTALTTVDIPLEPVGGEAVRLVEAAVSAKPPRSGRRSKAGLPPASPSAPIDKAEANLMEAERTPVEAAPPLIAPEVSTLEADPIELVPEVSMAEAAPPVLASESAPEPEPSFDGLASPIDPEAAPASEPTPVETLTELVATSGAAPGAAPDQATPSDDPVMTDRPIEPDPMIAFASKMAETFKSNLDASVLFWMAMLTVTSPSEAIDLNAAHLRDQMGRFAEAYKDFSVLARRAVTGSIVSLVSHRP